MNKEKLNKIATKILIGFGVLLVISILTCFIPTGKPQKENPVKAEAETSRNEPEYSISVITRDYANVGNAVRPSYYVLIPEGFPVEMLSVAADKIFEYAKSVEKINCLTVFFYDHEELIKWGTRFGSVLYAPNGNIADAVNIQAGDYSKFKKVEKLPVSINWENKITKEEAVLIRDMMEGKIDEDQVSDELFSRYLSICSMK